MTKLGFLRELREKLSESMPSSRVEENIRYYREYIENAVHNGKTESEVLDELGDPNLIARTILEAYTGEDYQNIKGESAYNEGSEAAADEMVTKVHKRIQWGCLGAAVVFILAVILIGWIIGKTLSFVFWIMPVLIPVVGVVLVYHYIKRR